MQHKHIIINKDLSQEYAISCLVPKVCTKIDNNNNRLKQKETGSDVMDYLKNERWSWNSDRFLRHSTICYHSSPLPEDKNLSAPQKKILEQKKVA